jgi:guanylate kinase
MTIVYIISAPSGSGKSTLVNEVRRLVPGLDFSVSYTTRAPRGSEQNGREYFFVSRADFTAMIRRGEFLEHAEVFGKNLYGTSRRFLREATQKNHDLVLDIDVQGAKQIREQLPDAVSIFILPPDRQTLEWRLRNRSEDDEDVIQRRLVTARREIANYGEYDYILVNDRLEQAADELKAVVQAERLLRVGRELTDEEKRLAVMAERCRLVNMRERAQRIVDSFLDGAG